MGSMTARVLVSGWINSSELSKSEKAQLEVQFNTLIISTTLRRAGEKRIFCLLKFEVNALMLV